jgi:hypothetical protein
MSTIQEQKAVDVPLRVGLSRTETMKRGFGQAASIPNATTQTFYLTPHATSFTWGISNILLINKGNRR